LLHSSLWLNNNIKALTFPNPFISIGHLDYLHNLAIVNFAFINMDVEVSFLYSDLPSFGFMPGSGIAVSYGSSFLHLYRIKMHFLIFQWILLKNIPIYNLFCLIIPLVWILPSNLCLINYRTYGDLKIRRESWSLGASFYQSIKFLFFLFWYVCVHMQKSFNYYWLINWQNNWYYIIKYAYCHVH
jgi:hypothetical protein